MKPRSIVFGVLLGVLLGFGTWIAFLRVDAKENPRFPTLAIPARPIDVTVPHLRTHGGLQTHEVAGGPPPTPVPSVNVLVIDDESSAPIAGAEMSILDAGDRWRRAGTAPQSATDDAGRALLLLSGLASPDPRHAQHAKENARVLLIRADGYLPQALDLGAAEGGGGEALIEARLTRGQSVSGTVVDPFGEPVAGARIDVLGRFGGDVRLARADDYLPGVSVAADYQRTRSDERGGYVASGLRGFPVQIRAFASHYSAFGPYLPVPRAKADGVRLVLYPLLRVAVQVVDAKSGEPIQEYACRALTQPQVMLAEYDLYTRPENVPADGRGAEGVTWFTYRLAGKVRSLTDMDPVSVIVHAPGYFTQKIDLPLVPASQWREIKPARVRLRRVGPDAAPLGRLVVRLDFSALVAKPKTVPLVIEAVDDEGKSVDGTTGRSDTHLREDGTAWFRLPAGTYRIRVGQSTSWFWWRGQEPWRAFSVPGAGLERITLKPAFGVLRVLASDGRGAPVMRVHIGLYRGARRRMMGEIDTEYLLHGEALAGFRDALAQRPGRLRFALAPGVYHVTLRREGARFADFVQREVRVQNGQQTDLHVVVPDGD